MRRREFIAALGSAAAWPLEVWAQRHNEQSRKLGALMGFESNASMQLYFAAFRDQLQTLGWTDGHNIRIEDRWGGGDMDRLRSLGLELITLKSEVLLAAGIRAAKVLHETTRTVPIVFAAIFDPIGQGIVESLAHPGGNITGFTLPGVSIVGKLLEVLKQLVPGIVNVALLSSPQNPMSVVFQRTLDELAPSFGVRSIYAPVSNAAEIEKTIASIAGEAKAGLCLTPDVVTGSYRELFVTLAAQYRLPAVYSDRLFVAAGGLVSYGTNIPELFRQSAVYVDRILRGAKPADLPIQQPTRYELVINLKAVKDLGLEVPPALAARADEVLE